MTLPPNICQSTMSCSYLEHKRYFFEHKSSEATTTNFFTTFSHLRTCSSKTFRHLRSRTHLAEFWLHLAITIKRIICIEQKFCQNISRISNEDTLENYRYNSRQYLNLFVFNRNINNLKNKLVLTFTRYFPALENNRDISHTSLAPMIFYPNKNPTQCGYCCVTPATTHRPTHSFPHRH